MLAIPIKLLHVDAKIPTQAREYDAGYDLYSLESYNLYPGERKLFKTGIAFAIPEGYYGRISPRSGLAFKNGVDVLAGTLDATYRGEVGVILLNTSHWISEGWTRPFNAFEPVIIQKGDRIAQIIFQRCENVQFNVADTLPETARGAGGFGSTGA